MTTRAALFGLILLVPIVGCTSRTAPEADAPAAAGGGAGAAGEVIEVQDYPLRGDVRKVDAAGRELQIRHEEIPGFMPAMTMPFKMPEETDFEDFQVGDVVEGILRVESKAGVTVDYQLLDLEVTKPVPASPTILESSREIPKLNVRPLRLQPGDEVPDFTMTDQNGETFKLSDLRGRVVALTFIYTRCPLPDFCPAMDRRFSELSRLVSASSNRAEKVRLISLSFDPDHDTPEVLREHARIRGAAPPVWTYANASHEELARVAARLGLTYGPMKDEIVHNLSTAVIGPDGRLVRLEVGSRDNAWTPVELLKTIVEALPAPSDG